MAGKDSGVVLGFLKYVLGFDSVAFMEGADEAQKRMKKAQKELQKTAGKMFDIGTALSIGITAPLTAFATKGVAEARETAAAMAQVNAAITSMGNAAGLSSAQLVAMADKLELSSLYEGDQILLKVTANLLTFGKVAGENFGRAQQAAVDLSTRMGTDLQASTLLIGKALNDPIKGITALTRAGIQFSAQQKEQIASFVKGGQAARAQAIILGELERQFGGAAAAAQNADPFNKATDAFNQMAETVGTALLPIIPVFTEAVVAVAEAFTSLSPETQKWVIIAGGIAALIGPIVIGLGGLVTAFAAILPLLLSAGPLFAAIGTALAALIPLIWSTVSALAAFALTPAGAIITAIALAVGAVYLAWKNWDKITGIVDKLVAKVEGLLGTRLAGILRAVLNPIEAVRKGFFRLYDAVVGHSYIPDMVDAIGQHMARLDAVLVRPAEAATSKAAQAFLSLQQSVGAILDRLFPEQARDNSLADEIRTLEAYAAQAKLPVEQLTEAIRRLRRERYGLQLDGSEEEKFDPDTLIDPDKLGKVPTPGQLEDVLERVANENFPDFSKSAAQTAAEVVESFAGMARDVVGSLRGMVSSFKSGDILGGLMGLLDIINQVASHFTKAPAHATRVYASGGFGGFRAMGGPTVPGKSYVVGENGPEWFTPGTRGFVTPHNDNGGRGPTRVIVDASPLLTTRIAQGDGQAAMAGAAGGVSSIYRRSARTFP